MPNGIFRTVLVSGIISIIACDESHLEAIVHDMVERVSEEEGIRLGGTTDKFSPRKSSLSQLRPCVQLEETPSFPVDHSTSRRSSAPICGPRELEKCAGDLGSSTARDDKRWLRPQSGWRWTIPIIGLETAEYRVSVHRRLVPPPALVPFQLHTVHDSPSIPEFR
jgi:hypothetical protein